MTVEPMTSFEGTGDGEAVYKGIMSELTLSVPGIDEAASFSEMLSEVKSYNFSVVVFDTAPTGHTLKLLGFPGAMEKGLEKLITLKEKFGGMITTMVSFINPAKSGEIIEKVFTGMERMKNSLEKVLAQFQNPVNFSLHA
eukprot:TRINITY_DN4990_c0_g1_i11.p3 TRINITY_DN4990_c0_g1~~TRINITY_DN4990_c0_g1_i11.p3  ORF type:complete len:140 (+),score=39.08 TRINITY_DN4990_c0_g1_i11:200-619(+)